MKFSPLKMIRDQLTPLPELEPMDLSGRTVLVTGSNVGLGLEAARHFARMQPARLILTSRDAAKGEAARKSILESMPSANVECWSLDLADFASTVAFCKRANAELDRLDTRSFLTDLPSVL
jgi:retinol dehydrogenase-12